MENKSFADRVLKWAGQNFSEFPWRLNRSPFEILIAEFLLKRTTATAASRVYDNFLARFPSLQEIASTSEEELVQVLSGVGLQRQRARSLRRLTTWLLNIHGGEIPYDLTVLKEVPGLGDYSAAAILSFGHGIPVAVLDANVERIITRVFRSSLPVRLAGSLLNEVAQRLLPTDKHEEYNYGLLDLGRKVCRYTNPKCGVCPLNKVCDFFENGGVGVAREPLRGHTESVKNKLRAVRLNRALSLKQLAQLAGVSKLTIIRIESGKSSPRYQTLEKLGIVLGVEPKELVS